MSRIKRFSDHITRTRRWKALRLLALRRDKFRCVKCGARGRLEVDHVISVRTAPERAFDLSNLQSLCPKCHGAKTRIEVGHPEIPPERAEWRRAVAALQTPTERKKHKCCRV
jgi:5-methylcytosine-specific restriction endonuclease McrA